MSDDRLDLLNDAQREVLRLVNRHMTSKEIARALGIAEDTVDQRVSAAMRKLRVTSRRDAARALADHETGLYGRPVYPSSDIAAVPLPLETTGHRSAGAGQVGVAEDRVVFQVDSAPTQPQGLLARLLSYFGERHDLTPAGTIADIMLRATQLALAVCALLSAYTVVSSLIAKHTH